MTTTTTTTTTTTANTTTTTTSITAAANTAIAKCITQNAEDASLAYWPCFVGFYDPEKLEISGFHHSIGLEKTYRMVLVALLSDL